MTGPGPTLFAGPTTVKAITEARAVVFLVGSYDGSGNYGDIAQFGAALALVERLEPGLLAVPVLERTVLGNHRALVEAGERMSPTPVFFDPAGVCDDDLLAVAAPASLAFGASYLYGGGYLNGSWGDRKLAMLHAAESLLAAGGARASCRIASGLQADAGWIAGLAETDAALLRSFEYIGTRDRNSGPALEALGSPAPVVDTADDSVAIIGALAPAAAPRDNGPLRVNLHFAEHEWVSGRAPEILSFYTGFLSELARLASRPLVAQPLIAYLDGRIDERPAAERLREACSAIGADVAEPLLLRPGTLTATAPRLSEAHLTLSCSYHVALTSLVLGVPALLLGDNPYYEQKAAGLAEDFDLSPAFMIDANADPAAVAGGVAVDVLGSEGAALRERLAAQGARLRRRRTAAEMELLSRLSAAAVAALDGRVGELTERLRERSVEPAQLRGEIGTMRTELEELRRRAAESPLEAELRVQEAEDRAVEAHQSLAEVLGSRSWRLAAPLRRAGALLRRR